MRCAASVVISFTLIASLAGADARAERPQTPQKPPAVQPPPVQAPPKPAPADAAPAAPAGKPTQTGTAGRDRQVPAKLSIAVVVTNMEGQPLTGVWAKASGPVDREGPTDSAGGVTFSNVTAGSYRLRFEHEDFITLERDVTVAAGRPLKVSVALSAAPPPPPPKVEPAPAPPPPQPVPSGDFQPVSVDIPDLFEKNYIGNAAVKRSPIGCTATSTSTLVQVRESIAEHTHADADELLYIVAGEGTHRIAGRDYPLTGGVFSLVPRGTSHSISRRGRQPLVVISTLSGPPCQPGK
jgi:Cupin domain/Carboxypeptidase regulatory-like domain